MCDPITLLTIGAAGASAIGKLRAGSAESEGEAIRAQIFDANTTLAESNFGLLRSQAEIARGNADVALARGRYQEGMVETQGRKVLAAQRVHFAAGHVDESYGSPLLVQARAAGQIAADVDLVRAGAAVDSANAMTQAANLEAGAAGELGKAFTSAGQARAARVKGSAAREAALWGAATSLLAGGAAIYKPGMSVPGAPLDLAPAIARS